MKKITIIASLLLTFNLLFGQENVGIGTTTPAESAILDISSSERGVLIPRTDTSAVNAYLASFGTAETGLMIFQTSDASFYFFNGSKWEKIGGAAAGMIDGDKDTQIKLVESNQDRMEYYLDGVKHVEMRKNVNGTFRIDVLNNNNNIGIGNSLVSNTSGTNNVAIGEKALRNNLTGGFNTAIGTEALIINSTGSQNIAIGYEALYNNNGSNNTSIGVLSLAENSTGNNNTALGQFALRFNEGSGNIALGYQAAANETGSDKLYIENSAADSSQALIYGDFAADSLRINGKLNINGAYAFPTTGGTDGQSLVLQSNGMLDWVTNSTLADADGDTKIDLEATSDSDDITFDLEGETKFVMEENNNGITTLKFKNNNFNTLIGDGAGKDLVSTSSGSNTIIGRFAGSRTTTGIQNTFLGGGAGDRNNGSRNTFIGLNAGADNLLGSDNVFLGNRAGINEQGSNKLYIENGGGDSSQALIYGDFAADSLRINGKLNINGAYAFPNASGSAGQFLALQANGSLDWNSLPFSVSADLISFSTFENNTLKLHQQGLFQDTVLVDLSDVLAAGLDLNGEDINKGVAIRYFICANTGDFPSPVTPNPNPVLGEVKLFAGSDDLAGWLPCEGQVLDIIDNTSLFSIIGTQYGGDGMTTFALPDLRNAVPVHN